MNKHKIKKVIKQLKLYICTACIIALLSGCSKLNNAGGNINSVVNDFQNEVIEKSSTDPFNFLEQAYKEGESYINSSEDINLVCTDKNGRNFSFTYNKEKYTAIYTIDNWCIKNSYKIKNKKDITYVCEALIKVHPIHGADKKSYRTADDMMYEWVQHNIAYDYLPDGNLWKSHARDVDLNPDDQGKSMMEMYGARANKGMN